MTTLTDPAQARADSRRRRLQSFFHDDTWEELCVPALKQRIERVFLRLSTEKYATLEAVQHDQELLRILRGMLKDPARFFEPTE